MPNNFGGDQFDPDYNPSVPQPPQQEPEVPWYLTGPVRVGKLEKLLREWLELEHHPDKETFDNKKASLSFRTKKELS